MSALPLANYLIEFASGTDRDRVEARLVLSNRGGNANGPNKAREQDDAFARGVAEGRAAVLAECEAAKREQKKAFAEQLVRERQAWIESEGTSLSKDLARGLEAVEDRIAGTLSRVLQPLLEENVRSRAIGELRALLRELARDGEAVRLNGSVPAGMLEVLQDRERCPEFAAARLDEGGCEIRLTIDEAVVESRMGAWMSGLNKGGP